MSARQKSMEMLVNMSLENKKRQFIFISPQSMQYVIFSVNVFFNFICYNFSRGVPANNAIQLIVIADPKRT